MDCGSASEAWFDSAHLSSSLTLTGKLYPGYKQEVTLGLRMDEVGTETGRQSQRLNLNLTLPD
jgi:hypothetical protein